MIRRTKQLLGLMLLLICSYEIAFAQPDIGTDRVETIAGEVRIVQVSEKKTQIMLRNKPILTVIKKRLPQMNDLNEISIYQVVRHPIPPFDEVVILNNWVESFTGCRPGVFFLGLKKNGAYRFSKSTPNCIDREISIKEDRIEIKAVPDVHTTEQMYLPIPGGKWVYRRGELHTIKLVVLPDPRHKPKTPNKGMHRSAKREFHNDGHLPRAR
jgi:hypothetical protein